MSPTRWNLPVRLDSTFDKVASEAHMHSEVIKGPGRFFAPTKKCPVRSPSTVIEVKRPDFMEQRRRSNMQIHQEVCFTATRRACLSISSRGAPPSKSCPRTRTVRRGVAGRRRKLAANRVRPVVKKSDPSDGPRSGQRDRYNFLGERIPKRTVPEFQVTSSKPAKKSVRCKDRRSL